jgi:hypothetical protein
MKKMLTILLSFLLVITVQGVVFAETSDDFISGIRLVNSPDFQEVKEVVENYSYEPDEIGEFLYDKAYAEVAHQPDGGANIHPDIIAAYYSSGSIGDNINIANGVRWQIPCYDGSLITVQHQDGQYQILGIQTMLDKNPDISQYTDIDLVKKTIDTSPLINANDIEQLLFIPENKYFTALVYVKSGGQEYIIPRSIRPDFTGLQNYQVYAASEFISILAENFEWTESNGESNLDSGGGSTDGASIITSNGEIASSSNETTSSNYVPLLIICILIVIALATVLLFRIRRKQN